MRILFVTSEIPYPPDNGVRIPSHHAMRLMSEAGHSLALAVLSDEGDGIDDRFQASASLCEEGMSFVIPLARLNPLLTATRSILKRSLYFLNRYQSPRFRRKLKSLIQGFNPDVIHFDLILMTQYLDTVPEGVRTIASINDSYALTLENSLSAGLYDGLEYLYRRYQLGLARKYESHAYAQFDCVHTMTEIDAAYLSRLNSKIQTCAISNGVEPSLFHAVDKSRGMRDVIFVAKLVGENLKNLRRFLEESWVVVRRNCPTACLRVVGKLPADDGGIREFADQLGGVKFQGYVENLADEYSCCGIAVVPVNKDCGIINKAIEAMAAGLAVVGFQKTFAGIPEVKPGIHAVVADDFDDMGNAISLLLRDDVMRSGIQREASEMAASRYTWTSRSIAYERMYSSHKNH